MSRTVSYWNKTAKKERFPTLEKDLEVETLIIGSGISGITCAWCLSSREAPVTVIEAGDLCDGTTGNTTGKVTLQHGIVYDPIYKKYGAGFARMYADSQKEAIEFVHERVSRNSIKCQLAENTAYIFTFEKNDVDKIKSEYEISKEIGIEAEFTEHPFFPKGSLCELGFKNQYVFHPVRYVNALAESIVKMGGRIYCSTKAVKLEDGDIKTVYCENNIKIKAKHVVMATQYPFYDGPNLFYSKLYANRSYGIAVLPQNEWPDGSYINIETPSRSIRTHVEDGERILIVVGEGHPTGRGEDNTELHFENLIRFSEELAGKNRLLAEWSAQDYKTPDNIPYIGRISDHSNIYVASGYGKWGLSNGTLAGMMISELILKGSCRYEELYSRARRDVSSSAGTIISEVAGQVGELIKSKFEKTEGIENLKQGEGRVINFEGRRAGIYRDFHDYITILDISCTHLSTELNFNSAEKTWDCPAHGGRYNTDGKILEGPPKNSLPVLFKGAYKELLS